MRILAYVYSLRSTSIPLYRMGLLESTIVGTLEDRSCLDQIHAIDCLTLLMNGADNEAQDECVGSFFAETRKVRWVTLARSGHKPFFEEPDCYFEIVGTFLAEA